MGIQKNIASKKISVFVKIIIALVLSFIVLGLIGMAFPSSENISSMSQKDNNKRLNDGESLIKVITITGKQAQTSEEFAINSKEVKFVYRCSEGTVVCNAWVQKIGGERKEIFHSSGGTGNSSGEMFMPIGPGNFYIKIDTENREYQIDIFQAKIAATEEEVKSAEVKTDKSRTYRDINGFKLTSENAVGNNEDIQTYSYESENGVYDIELDIWPSAMISRGLEEQYTLGRKNLEINDINIEYAFNKGSTLNGTEVFKPYEDAEFEFSIGDKVYSGFIKNIKKIDEEGTESILKLFLNILIPKILND
jgi:hypothetical protein